VKIIKEKIKMAEYLNNSELRVKSLLEFSMGIMNDENGTELIKKHQDAIDHVTPHDMIKLEDMQIQMGFDTLKIKKYVDRVINVFFSKLKDYKWEKPAEDTFLYYLMEENKALKSRLEIIKALVVKNDFENNRKQMFVLIKDLEEVESHYVKKENILFPYLEKKLERYRALSVMWSIDDDIRKKIKKLIQMLEDKNTNPKEFNKEIGQFFFLIYGLIQKEDLVVYPVASEVISDDEWEDMHMQSFDYKFSFIETPKKRKKINIENKTIKKDVNQFVIKSETGEMTVEQALLVFNKLPLDITFVDENNKVKFFSKPDDRFFPRSPAIVGRDVSNCHPPESVHIVEKIVEAFRNGEKDNAQFWLNMRGKFILIQYFALRDDLGNYKGVLEVSQDVTGIRSLEGQQRLLDWGD
jgi:hypothetical protein